MERSPWERETHRRWRKKGSNFHPGPEPVHLHRSPLRLHLWRRVCLAKPFLTEFPRQRWAPAIDPFGRRDTKAQSQAGSKELMGKVKEP